jgi:hypothetical protein
MLINNDGHITATNIKLASVVQESTIYPSLPPPFLKTNYDCKYVSFLTDNFTKHKKVNSYCVLFDLGSPTAIHIWINEKRPAQIRLHSKRPHTITKMNDRLSLDSTITGSMKAYHLPKVFHCIWLWTWRRETHVSICWYAVELSIVK